MSQRVWIKVVVAVWIVLATCAAYATDATVAGDAYVNSASPATNYGGLSNLYVGNGGTALIQFNLSSLPSGTTASQIGKATLKIYVNRINTSGAVSVQPVTSAWSESSVTFNTIPTLGSAIATFTPTASQQFVVIDVTSLVQRWVTTPSSNYGIALSSTVDPNVCWTPRRTTRPAMWRIWISLWRRRDHRVRRERLVPRGQQDLLALRAHRVQPVLPVQPERKAHR